MKKLMSLSLIIVMIMLGIITDAEARKGQTSATSSTKSSKSSSYSRMATSINSTQSSKNVGGNRFLSLNKKGLAIGTSAVIAATIGEAKNPPEKPSFNNTLTPAASTAINNAFGKAAKEKKAKIAWLEYNKRQTTDAAPSASPQTSTTALSEQLTTLKKQLEIEKNQARNERLVSQMAVIAEQIANARKQPRTNQSIFRPSADNSVAHFPATTTAIRNTTTPSTSSNHGMSMFWIILALGGGIVLIIWLVKRNQPTTIYRI